MSDVQVKVDSELYHIKFDEKDSNKLKVGETEYEIELLRDHGNNVSTYLINNKVFTLQCDEKGSGEYKILHNNFEYISEIKTETRALLEKFIKSTGSAKGEGALTAPMPGLVVKINVAVGDEVAEGDKIIIIEAMKMENALSAPVSGKINSIKVKEGQAVDKGTVLIEIDSD